jgi:hypothetical protein
MRKSELRWRKASASGTQGGNCVEIADHHGAVLVRDTRDRGAVQRYTVAEWRAFVARAGSRCNDRG